MDGINDYLETRRQQSHHLVESLFTIVLCIAVLLHAWSNATFQLIRSIRNVYTYSGIATSCYITHRNADMRTSISQAWRLVYNCIVKTLSYRIMDTLYRLTD